MWRPLVTASFPTTQQGLVAFKKLREYKKLHELYWKEPAALGNGMIDLENPYAPKPEPRPPKKERSKIIMDQKANTIADLAAVLCYQADTAARTEREKEEVHAEAQRRMLAVREEMLALDQTSKKGALSVLGTGVAAQREKLAMLNKSLESSSGSGLRLKKEIRHEKETLRKMVRQYAEMAATKDAFAKASAAGTATLAAKEQVDGETKASEQPTSQQVEASSAQVSSPQAPRIFYPPHFFTDLQGPAFTTHLTRSGKPKKLVDKLGRTFRIPKRGRLRNLWEQSQNPIYTGKGVVLKWTNPLDAELAETWPPSGDDGVVHADAGFLRHTAPDPYSEGVFDVEQMLRTPKALQELGHVAA